MDQSQEGLDAGINRTYEDTRVFYRYSSEKEEGQRTYQVRK